jgi:hypothetical protein
MHATRSNVKLTLKRYLLFAVFFLKANNIYKLKKIGLVILNFEIYAGRSDVSKIRGRPDQKRSQNRVVIACNVPRLGSSQLITSPKYLSHFF